MILGIRFYAGGKLLKSELRANDIGALGQRYL
jgi:hypothetical protein